MGLFAATISAPDEGDVDGITSFSRIANLNGSFGDDLYAGHTWHAFRRDSWQPR